MPTILVADDSRVQAQLLTTSLHEKGFHVISAADALQAWMTALRAKPDAIILDINMPGGSGMEVLKRLRMSTKTHNIPVVVVSGATEVQGEEMARSLGASEFLHKPVDLDLLNLYIAKALKTRTSDPV